MSLNYYLDMPIKFLFVNSKGKCLIDALTLTSPGTEGHLMGLRKLLNAQQNYEVLTRRYMGLGFFASFIPGTNAFAARMDYVREQLEVHKAIQEILNGHEFPFHGAIQLSLTPFYFLENFAENYCSITDTALNNIVKIRKDSLLKLVSYFPIASDFIQVNSGSITLKKDWYENLGHTLVNPLRIISSLLRFLHRTVDAIFEIGAENGTESSLGRKFFKGLSAFLFLPVRLLVGVVEAAVDFVLDTLHTLLIEPWSFAYETGKQLVTTWSKELLYIPDKEYKGIKVLESVLMDAASKKMPEEASKPDDLLNDNKSEKKPTTLTPPEQEVSTGQYTLITTSPSDAETYMNYGDFWATCHTRYFTVHDGVIEPNDFWAASEEKRENYSGVSIPANEASAIAAEYKAHISKQHS